MNGAKCAVDAALISGVALQRKKIVGCLLHQLWRLDQELFQEFVHHAPGR